MDVLDLVFHACPPSITGARFAAETANTTKTFMIFCKPIGKLALYGKRRRVLQKKSVVSCLDGKETARSSAPDGACSAMTEFWAGTWERKIIT
jgi:hypothetical protein